MSLSFDQSGSAIAGYPRTIQHLSISGTAAYSIPIEKNTIVRVVVGDESLVKICPEYAFGGYFGSSPRDSYSIEENSTILHSNIYDNPTHIFASNAEDAELHANGVWDLSGITTNTPTLARDETNQTHVLEIALDDADDVIQLPLNKWPGGRHRTIPGGQSGMVLRFRHKESDANSGLAWTIQSSTSDPLSEATAVATDYWDDGAAAWTATLTDAWTDLVDQTALTTTSLTWNAQAFESEYTLMLKATTDYASDTASIYSLSVHEPIIASQGARLGIIGADYYFTMPVRGVLGIIGDGAETAYISEML